MRSWLRRRRERLERAEAEADFSTSARPPVPRRAGANTRQVPPRWRESGTGSRWRLRGRRSRMDANPVAQFRIQFFGVPTNRAPTILGEVDLLASDAFTAIRQAAHAAWPPCAIGFCLIDREGRAVFGRRKDDCW